MTTRSIRLGLIGCGSIAPTHARAIAELAEEAQLVSCCDVLPERASKLATDFGLRTQSLREMLRDPDIDAVTVCTPSGMHAEHAIAALRAGKHVVVEKPMEISVRACDRMLRAQETSGRKLAVISQHRFDPASRLVKQALDSSELGPLIQVEVQIPWYRTQEYYDSGEWRGTWELDGGGCVMNQGVHTVDLMRWFCGPLQSLCAHTRTAAHERIAVEDALCGVMEFQNGAIGTVMASTSAFPGFAARIALYGHDGSAIIEGDSLQLLQTRAGRRVAGDAPTQHAMQVATGGTRAATHAVSEKEATKASKWGDAHREQLRDFIHCCTNGSVPVVDGIAGRQAVEVVLALYRSAKTGRVIRFA